MARHDEARGRFCWFDLMTTDVEAAKTFYTELLGWEVDVWESGELPYPMWKASERPLGGVMLLPEDAKKMGAPPHWMAYLATADIDATVKQAQELGGEVLVPSTEIPTVGHFAVLRDPQGAPFAALMAVDAPPGHEGDKQHGEVTWHELATTDYEAAFQFYEALFGWKKTDSMDRGEEMGGTYQMFGHSKTTEGGMYTKPPQMPGPPAWLFYFHVDDVAAKVERAEQLGAQLLNGPMEVPGGDTVAQLMDPQGAAFALHAEAEKV